MTLLIDLVMIVLVTILAVFVFHKVNKRYDVNDGFFRDYSLTSRGDRHRKGEILYFAVFFVWIVTVIVILFRW